MLAINLDKIKLIRYPQNYWLWLNNLHTWRFLLSASHWALSIRCRICTSYPSEISTWIHMWHLSTFLISMRVSTWMIGEWNICYWAVWALNHELSKTPTQFTYATSRWWEPEYFQMFLPHMVSSPPKSVSLSCFPSRLKLEWREMIQPIPSLGFLSSLKESSRTLILCE